jgi:hypothetical protein
LVSVAEPMTASRKAVIRGPRSRREQEGRGPGPRRRIARGEGLPRIGAPHGQGPFPAGQ